MLPGPGGAFAPSRGKLLPRRAPASAQSDVARLKVWESEGGSLAKDADLR